MLVHSVTLMNTSKQLNRALLQYHQHPRRWLNFGRPCLLALLFPPVEKWIQKSPSCVVVTVGMAGALPPVQLWATLPPVQMWVVLPPVQLWVTLPPAHLWVTLLPVWLRVDLPPAQLWVALLPVQLWMALLPAQLWMTLLPVQLFVALSPVQLIIRPLQVFWLTPHCLPTCVLTTTSVLVHPSPPSNLCVDHYKCSGLPLTAVQPSPEAAVSSMYPWSPVSVSGGQPPPLAPPSTHLSPHLAAHLAPPCALHLLPKGIGTRGDGDSDGCLGTRGDGGSDRCLGTRGDGGSDGCLGTRGDGGSDGCLGTRGGSDRGLGTRGGGGSDGCLGTRGDGGSDGCLGTRDDGDGCLGTRGDGGSDGCLGTRGGSDGCLGTRGGSDRGLGTRGGGGSDGCLGTRGDGGSDGCLGTRDDGDGCLGTRGDGGSDRCLGTRGDGGSDGCLGTRGDGGSDGCLGTRGDGDGCLGTRGGGDGCLGTRGGGDGCLGTRGGGDGCLGTRGGGDGCLGTRGGGDGCLGTRGGSDGCLGTRGGSDGCLVTRGGGGSGSSGDVVAVPSPVLWAKQDVRAWLEFCAEDFSIAHVRPDTFDMNGKALCLLTRKDFMERDPASGDLLYNALQRILSPAKTDMTLHPHFTAVSPAFPHALPAAHTYTASHGHGRSQQSGIIVLTRNSPFPGAGAGANVTGSADYAGSGNGCSENVTQAEAKQATLPGLGGRPTPVPILPHPPHSVPQPPVPTPAGVSILSVAEHHHHHTKHAEVPDGVLSPAPTTDPESTSSDADSVNNESTLYERGGGQEGGGGGGGAEEGGVKGVMGMDKGQAKDHSDMADRQGQGLVLLPPTTITTPTTFTTPATADSDEDMAVLCGTDVSGDCRLLWEFIYQLLQERGGSSRSYVCWEGDGQDLVFRIVNPTGLAELWGHQKNRTNMTYEKLSRALRYYYKMNIIKKVPGKRLTYKFLQHPTKIQKGQRGAKPHCMRNLLPNPHPPSAIAPSPGPRPHPAPRQCPEDGPCVALSPSGGDGLAHSPHSPPSPLPLPPTPVPLFPSATRRGASLPPCVDEHVRSSLKDHLQDRQLTHPKLEAVEDPHSFLNSLPKRHRHYLEMIHHQRQQQELQKQELELQQQQQQQEHEGGAQSLMECDYQEEPEDLSVKPGLALPIPNPALLQSPHTPLYSPRSYSPNTCLPSHPSPGLYSAYPPHSYTPSPPPSSHSYTPPPPPSSHRYTPSPPPSSHSYTPPPPPSSHSYTPPPPPSSHFYTSSPVQEDTDRVRGGRMEEEGDDGEMEGVREEDGGSAALSSASGPLAAAVIKSEPLTTSTS
ncbi:hypothetical protein ACOMHN_026351 [Nucella lapillus]